MWTLLLILVATAAASDSPPRCPSLIHDECRSEIEPQDFPGTEEELEEICKFAKNFYGCAVDHLDLCGEDEEGFADYIRETHPTIIRICNEESLLYRGLADSLPCLKKMSESSFDCSERDDADTIENYVENLSNVGVTVLGEGEEDLSECLRDLYMFSCISARIGKECGGIAKDVAIEILQGLDTPFQSCPAYLNDQLPAIANALQMEEEIEEELENVLKKK